jgi:DNA-binding MarR family transcriptional regulator
MTGSTSGERERDAAVGDDLGVFLGYLIRRAQQAHVSVWMREVSTSVTSVQFGVLATVASSPGISQRELGDRLGLDRSTSAEVTRRLEKRGLVERSRTAGDRRTNELYLTADGTAELARLTPGVRRVDAVLTSALSIEDRHELERLLRAILGTASEDAGAEE